MNRDAQGFSVLMSIYYKERPEYFDRAMRSIWDEQTVKPDEIILVQDGPLTDELYYAINSWKEKLGKVFKTVSLEKNVGLGDSLNIGLKKCRNELVARMDTDDIALPQRFEKQLKVFQNSDIDICSSWVAEFDKDETQITSYRKVPEHHIDILKFSKKRCPINHPAVMYKKTIVEKAGGYQKMMWFEDYYLWARMLLNGAVFYNIQESLVKIRTGRGQINRRSGVKYALRELECMKELNKIGFLNIYEFIRNVSIRFIIRIMPISIIKVIYKKIRS